MLITIYDRAGKPKAELSPNDSSTQAKEVQGDSILTLSFTHYEHIELDVDDYADFLGERFWLTEKCRPKQRSQREWAYDLKLYGVESMIKRLLVIKTVDGEDDPVFTLTAPAREHLAMIVNCMNKGMGNISDWKVGQVDGTENIVVDYHGKYCDEALKEIAEKVGAEWWIEGQTVNICKCEHGEPVALGYGKGLCSIEPDMADNVKFYTRLYPVGCSRNIDRERYGYSRLQLPGGAKYVEVNADKYGRVDHYEADAFAGIYPRRTGEVSSVRSEERKGEDGKPFTIYYFTDDSLPFDPNDYEIGGLVKRVSFQEGSELGGLGDEDNGTYYFEVNFNSDTREFEIITIWPYGDDMQLPGGTLIPKAGDRYILWNIRMPDEYYALAEAEFMAAVNAYNADHAIDISVYKAPTDHVWIEDNRVDLQIGRRVRLESDKYFPGSGYRDSRITKITRKVNLPTSMDIEIGDALSRTSQQRMTDSITDVRSYVKSIKESISLPDIIKTGDQTLPTDNNLYSARRTQADFMSKVRDDRSKGLVASDVGFDVGEFLSGVSGGRIAMDKESGHSYGELDKLYIRVRAYFESLTVIEREALAGEQQITPGGGVKCALVVAVDADGNALESVSAANAAAYRCYFLSEQDGEKRDTKIKAGDQAIAQTFNAATGTANKVSNKRWWRYVTAVENDAVTDDRGNHYGYIEVSRNDCESGSFLPEAGDEIAQFGNRTDASRQAAIVISTVSADSPSMKLFAGIGSGTTNAEHYSLVDRDIISYGFDHATGRAYMRCYGDLWLGSRDGNSFVRYDAGEDKWLFHNVSISATSTIGGKSFAEIFQGYDDTEYLRKAFPQNTDIAGGVMVSSLVSLGYTDANGARHTYAGLNGVYETSKTIASWWGGPMVDRYYAHDGSLRTEPLESGFAAAVARMDGSGYYVNGLFQWSAAGIDLGFGKIKLGVDGSMKIASGIEIDGGASSATLGSILNFIVGISNLLAPIDRDNKEMSFDDAIRNPEAVYAIKAKTNFVGVGEITAYGTDGEGGKPGEGVIQSLGGLADVSLTASLAAGQALVWDGKAWVNRSIASGLDESALSLYLQQNKYATQTWVANQEFLTEHQSLAGYATETWVEAKKYLTKHQAIYGLTFAAGAFEAKAYNPAAAAVTVNIPTTTDHLSEGSSRLYFTDARAVAALAPTVNSLNTAISKKLDKAAFEEMFEKVTVNGSWYIRAKANFVGAGEITAYGADSENAGGTGSGTLDVASLAAYLSQNNYLTRPVADSLYQPKGNYLTRIAVADAMNTVDTSASWQNKRTDLTVRFYDVYNNGGPTSYGDVMEIAGRSGHWQPQLWFDGSATGRMRYRNRNYNTTAFGSWYTLAYTSDLDHLLSAGLVSDFNATTINKNGLYHWNTSTANRPADYGTMFQWSNVGSPTSGTMQHWITQLASATNGRLHYRVRTNNADWTTWRSIAFADEIPSLNNYLHFGLDDKYVAARFLYRQELANKAAEKYIEFWQSGAGWFNFMAGKFIVNGGTASQFLKGDGSLDSTSYAPNSALANYVTLATAQTISGAKTFNGGITLGCNINTTGRRSIGSSLGHATLDKYHRIDLGYHSYDSIDIYENAVNFYNNGHSTVHASIKSSGITANAFFANTTTLCANLNADLLDGEHASVFARGGKAQYKAAGTAAGRWVRIAQTSYYPATGIISIVNTWYNNPTQGIILAYTGGYRTGGQQSLVQLSGRCSLFTKARIVYPTNSDAAYYIEVFYQTTSLENTLYVSLSNAANMSLLSSYTEGSVPSGYATKEILLENGMSSENLRLSGDITGVGTIYCQGSAGSYREGIRIKPFGGWSTILLGGQDLTADSGTSDDSWGLFNHDGHFYINKGTSSGARAPRLWGHANGWTVGNTGTASYALNAASFICDSWVRTKGNTGWYNESYGGGIYMTDTSWVRIYNGKGLYGDGEMQSGSAFNRTYYGGASWNNGKGAYNISIYNNDAQTPLLMAYRQDAGISATGANRLFALELLNAGTDLHFAFGGTNKFTMTSAGNFLAVGEVTAYSDRRLKSDIKPLYVKGRLRPVRYQKDGRYQVGLIAQEVRELCPEAVMETNTPERYLALSHNAAYAAALSGVYGELDDHERRLKKLESHLTH